MHRALFISALLLMISSMNISHANSLPDWSLETKSARSDIVVIGYVTTGSVSASPCESANPYFAVRVTNFLKGHAPGVINILCTSGIAERNIPPPKLHKYYILFLLHSRAGAYVSIAGMNGVILIN